MSGKMFRSAICIFCGTAIGCLAATAKERSTVKSDAAFLAMAAEADMTMAHVGQMAEDRAAEGSVKDFGKTLAQDHTDDYHQLTELSSKTGDAIPKAIDKPNDREIAALDRYKGKTFDHQFLERQASDHEKLIKAFKEEAEHGTNADIKAYANKALPIMERHLHDAQDLVKPAAKKG
jgi:putative membrane protein